MSFARASNDRLTQLEAENATLRRLLGEANHVEVELERVKRRQEATEGLGRTGTFEWNPATRGISMSRELLRILGFQFDGIAESPRQLLRRVSPAHRPSLIHAVREVLHHGHAFSEEFQIRTDDGPKWLQFRGFVERDARGAVARVIALCRDVSDQQTVMERLRRNDSLFQRLFNSTPDGMVLIRASDKAILDANVAFCRATGFSRAEVVGRTDTEIGIWVNDGHRLQAHAEIARALRIGNMETRFRLKDGRELDVLIAARIFDLAGEQLMIVNIRDISDYKSTMRALIESEDRFAQTFEDAPVASVVIRRRDLIVLEANAAVPLAFGISREELVDQSLNVLFQQSASEHMQLARSLCDAPQDAVPLEMTKGDGSRLDVLASSRCVQLHGEPCSIVMLQDVTALREAQGRFSVAFEANPNALLFANLDDGKLLHVNAGFVRLLGHQDSDVLGQTIQRLALFVHEDDLAALLDAMQSGPVTSFPAELKRRDGTVFPAHLSAAAIRNSGQAWCIISVHDISRERHAQQTLRFSEERFETLFRTAPLAIALCKADNYVLSDVNPAFADLFDVNIYRVREGVVSLRTQWTDASQFQAFEDAMRSEGQVRDLEATMHTQHGTVVALLSARAVDLQGTPHVLLYASNITEFKNIQEQLRQVQKMEAIGHLAGGIAHDFNNLLNGIQGFGELLLLERSLSDSARHKARQIISTVQRAAQLTKQLLIFARRESPALKPINVHDVIHNTVEILERSIDRRVQIVRHLAAANPLVLGDESQIENALLNLCINARDAMPQGGRITVTTGLLNMEEDWCRRHNVDSAPEHWLRLSVTDTGSGIPPEIMTHIFEPFFTTKGVGHGTGLGLPAVWGMVRAHNGVVEIDTAPNAGTTFHLYLRPCEERREHRRRSEVKQLTLGTGRILVVDDEAMLRELLTSMLTTLGYEITTAEDGEDAVEQYRRAKEPFELVVLDMTMPRMNGHDTFAALKILNPQVRVLLASGFVQSDELNATLNNGAIGVLHKPFDLSTLSRRVNDAMTRRITMPG